LEREEEGKIEESIMGQIMETVFEFEFGNRDSVDIHKKA